MIDKLSKLRLFGSFLGASEQHLLLPMFQRCGRRRPFPLPMLPVDYYQHTNPTTLQRNNKGSSKVIVKDVSWRSPDDFKVSAGGGITTRVVTTTLRISSRTTTTTVLVGFAAHTIAYACIPCQSGI